MTHNILLTRLHGKKKFLLTRDMVPKDPYRRRHGPAEEGRMTPTLTPFVRPGSLQSPTFWWMLCDPSVFYRIWFWPSADAENTKPDHDEKSLHRHTIPCFSSSKSPFGLQLGSQETPHASHHETEEERCLRRNQRRAAQAFWVRCEPSTPRRDPKNGRTRSQVIENSELFKKLDPGAQFQWERISSAVQPCRSLRGSEAEPTTNSRYSSFQGHERSLDPRRLRRAFRHSRTNSASPKGLRYLQPLVLSWGEEKSDSPFVSTLSPPSRLGPDMQVFQQASGSPDQAYPDPRCEYVGYRPAYGPSALHLPRAIWRGIVAVPTDVP